MSDMFPWFQIVVAFLVIYVFYHVASKRKTRCFPPMYSGWLPWLGCALEFGKEPLAFIELKRKELGPVFTIKVAGERMTFLTQVEDFHFFFKSSNVDFQKAVQDAVQNVASVTEEAFFVNHTKIHDTVKGRLAAANLPAICQNLFAEFKKHLSEVQDENSKDAQRDLAKVVRSTMYKSVMKNLFGDGALPTDKKEEFEELEKNFVIFDDQFEYGARLPPMFIKQWSSSKNWLLKLFSKVTSKNRNNMPQDPSKQTLHQALLAVVDKEFAPNWGLLLLWASLANAIPITFWALAFIYNDSRVLSKLQTEVDSVLKNGENVSEGKLTQMPYARQCILEAIRLRSPGIITRRVINSFTAQGHTVPAGDLLMVSPFWAHRNAQLFPDPDIFKPERWDKVDRNSFPEGFIAFGGGRYQCPGRWFALMEIQMYVCMFVNMFDCNLISGVPDLCKLHLVGTQQPVQTCPVLLSKHISD